MKRGLSFGSMLITITAGLFGILTAISPMVICLGNSMSSSGAITHPEYFVSVIGGVMLILFGLVAIVLSIIGIFKKGKALAITNMVFQALLFIGALLALIGGLNCIKGFDTSDLMFYGLQLFAPFIALVLAYAGAFTLNLFNVLKMNKQQEQNNDAPAID